MLLLEIAWRQVAEKGWALRCLTCVAACLPSITSSGSFSQTPGLLHCTHTPWEDTWALLLPSLLLWDLSCVLCALCSFLCAFAAFQWAHCLGHDIHTAHLLSALQTDRHHTKQTERNRQGLRYVTLSPSFLSSLPNTFFFTRSSISLSCSSSPSTTYTHCSCPHHLPNSGLDDLELSLSLSYLSPPFPTSPSTFSPTHLLGFLLLFQACAWVVDALCLGSLLCFAALPASPRNEGSMTHET